MNFKCQETQLTNLCEEIRCHMKRGSYNCPVVEGDESMFWEILLSQGQQYLVELEKRMNQVESWTDPDIKSLVKANTRFFKTTYTTDYDDKTSVMICW